MKKITIIMPYLNEGEESSATIRSIYATANPSLFQIVAINDASEKEEILPDFPEVTVIKNISRIGVDACRHKGVESAQTPYCLIIDAHMRFKNDNWAEKAIELASRESQTIWCTTCLGLGYGTMDINKYKGKYYGADLLLVDRNATPSRPAREVLEPKWRSSNSGKEYELPCVLGANYIFNRDWFLHLRGLSGLKMWGTSEPFLSVKSWLSGGKCKISTDIEIGHMFRDNAPYSTEISALIYNKLFFCKTLLPEIQSRILENYMKKDHNFKKAQKMIESDAKVINEYQSYFNSVFKVKFEDYCKKFDIYVPQQ